MGRKAIISVDLARMVGDMQLHLAPPRQHKEDLELAAAAALLGVLEKEIGGCFTGARKNKADPPDILFEYDGSTVGLELTELLPVNRLEKDDVLRRLRERLLSRLPPGDSARNYVVDIFLTRDYAKKLHLTGLDRPLAELLTQAFDNPVGGRRLLVIPPQLQGLVSRIIVEQANLSGDPRLRDDSHPLILFGAQDTLIVPERDIPEMLDARLERKLLHDVAMPTWLLVWSQHPALACLNAEVVECLKSYLAGKPSKYERVFYLNMLQPGFLAHMPGRDNR